MQYVQDLSPSAKATGGGGGGEALSEALAHIPLSSVLADWKLLLRALEAWYSNDEELFDKCLRKLTDVEGKAKRIVEGLQLLHKKDHPVTADSLDSALCIHGLYKVANDLVETDKYVQRGQTLQAFKFARKQSPRFLNQECVKDQIITEGFVRLYQYALPDNDYRKFIDKLIADKRTPAASQLPFLRVNYKLGHNVLKCPCPKCISNQGREYLDALKADGISRKESAHLKYHLAHRLVGAIEMEYEYIEDGDLYLCVELLEEALQEDPEMIRAGLLLAKCYLDSKNGSKGNALLDKLAKKFPNDPAVLFAAGCRCIERKTYVRGLKQLEQAYAVDPHLSGLKEKYVEGLLAYALQCYQKGLLDKGRDCFERMKPHLQECSAESGFILGNRWMRLRQLQMETHYNGDPKLLKAQVEKEWQGQETLNSIFADLITQEVGSLKQAKQSAQKLTKLLRGKLLAKKLEPQDVYALLAYIKHHKSQNNERIKNEHLYADFITDYCFNYVKERLEGILKLLWALIPDFIPPGMLLKLTKVWSKADRQNPQLKIMSLMARDYLGDPLDELLKNLDKAMETAQAREDTSALHQGRKLRKKLENETKAAHSAPPPNFDFENEYDDDYEGSDEEDEFSLLEDLYQKWCSCGSKERKDLEAGIKTNLGAKAAQILISSFKERLKYEQQTKMPPINKKAKPKAAAQKTRTTTPAKAKTTSQMNFNFDV